jgi:hypothetical protein
MNAKKVYEFKQGGDPYKTMGLGGFQVGDIVRIEHEINWNDETWELNRDEVYDSMKGTYVIRHINVTFNDIIAGPNYVETGIKGIGIVPFLDDEDEGYHSENWFSEEDARKFIQKI